MLKIIAGTAGFFLLLWGGAFVTDLISNRHWAGAPSFITFYAAACGCLAYAVTAVMKWKTFRDTEKLNTKNEAIEIDEYNAEVEKHNTRIDNRSR